MDANTLNAAPEAAPRLTQAQTLRRLDRLSRMLDEAYRIPGTSIRFGLDSLIGLLPVAGDVASAALATYLIYEARRLGLPRRVIAKMALNVAIDMSIGAIPLAGDVADVFWRANMRNMALIRRHLR
jgi:hypothetical protein